MKHIKGAVAETTKVLIFMVGLILCMCDTRDISNQICVSLAGIALMIISVLPTVLRDWRASWRTS